MSDWISEFIKSSGYMGICLLMFVENIFPPIPSEVIMPLAGYLVSEKELNLIGVIIGGSLGAFIGAVALYYFGYFMGEERLKRWAHKHGRWVAITPEEIDRVHHWFDKHGGATVFFFRLAPGLRSLISIPAGIARMKLLPFMTFTLVGTIIWSSALALAGYYLSNNFALVESIIGPVSTGIILLLLTLYLWRVIRGSIRK